ncbi:hypothetical protein KDH_53110 [Dictyobacter sp. S3.2.2.5]|uniref:Protein-glutamine gamma-glutamyltransferase-like C-terminal domain-containing protein n=1 Tax=Dictyobacter halimunensis TaxID=3026934 RepID=A0ABQ6FXF4_9CHLR|nr:hypothetical protein KDH_53110 [Dictyobacter sp. S3.2.2.5]
MSLFRPSATDRPQPSVPARVASNWIELLAIPIASALMEAQPIFLLLQLIFLRLAQSFNYLDVGSIVLTLLLFHWWGMWGYHRRQQRNQQLDYEVGMHVTSFDVLGIILGLLLLGLTHYYALGDTFTVVFMIVLTGWAWKRGVDRARGGFSDDQLILFFKIGLGIILLVLTFSLLGDVGSAYSINDELLRDLPIFFLSGFVALSFTRIGAARKEQARQSHTGVKEGSSRWIVALTIAWLVLIALCVLLEILPNAVLVMLLSPFWSVVDLIAQFLLLVISWIFYGVSIVLNWLLGWLGHLLGPAPAPPAFSAQKKPAPKSLSQVHLHQNIADPTTMLLLRMLVIAVAVAVLIAIVLFVKNRQQHGEENTLPEEEEVREGLDMQQIRRERRQERQQQAASSQLEQLETDSMRARYRGFLQSMAEKGGEFGRYPTETPAEYQQRLLLLSAHKLPAGSTETPADPAILDEFTRAYAQERYGQQKPNGEQQNFLRQWLPHLFQRFSTYLNAAPRPVQKKPYQPSRWGED